MVAVSVAFDGLVGVLNQGAGAVFGLVLTTGFVTAVVTKLFDKGAKRDERVRDGYAATTAALVAWGEFPYRVARRTSDENDALAAKADELGIDRPAALALHREYLDDLARAALADGIVTDGERSDLDQVAALLSLGLSEVDSALLAALAAPPPDASPETHVAAPGRFCLDCGDMVVFTGDMNLPREEWMVRAAQAGLVPHTGVTKMVVLVVAADPDSLSGKARKAADYGIPIVTEHAFARMLEDLTARSAAL